MARYYEETALIEFVKERTPTINGETTMECVERAIRKAPTADVVPKSEFNRVAKELERVEALYFAKETQLKKAKSSADEIAEELSETIIMKDELFNEVIKLRGELAKAKSKIVSCKECKHRHTPFCALWYGFYDGADYLVEHGEEFSCSWGESEDTK